MRSDSKIFDLRRALEQVGNSEGLRSSLSRFEKHWDFRERGTIFLSIPCVDADFLRIEVASVIHEVLERTRLTVIKLCAENLLGADFKDKDDALFRSVIEVPGNEGRVLINVGRSSYFAKDVISPVVSQVESPNHFGGISDRVYHVGIPKPGEGAIFSQDAHTKLSRDHCSVTVMWKPTGGYIVKVQDHSRNNTTCLVRSC